MKPLIRSREVYKVALKIRMLKLRIPLCSLMQGGFFMGKKRVTLRLKGIYEAEKEFCYTL